MTRHKHMHTGLVTPSLPQRLLTAMLRLFAVLVLNVASTLQMIIRRCPVIGTREMPADLPGETSDTQQQETESAAPYSQSSKALIPRSASQMRVSKDEGALTRATPTESLSGLSRESRSAQHRGCQLTVPLVPAKVGTQGSPRSLSGPEAASLRKAHHHSWLPIFIRMSGENSAPSENAAA